jgi:hypothetical protein
MNIQSVIGQSTQSNSFFRENEISSTPVIGKESKSEKKDSFSPSSEYLNSNSEKSESNNPNELSEKEQKQVDNLKSRDAEVRRHEQAHLAAAAGLNASGPYYQYTTGPDGRKYVTGGEVRIDNSAEKEPQDTIRKMQRVRAAALAPANPSSQDRSVAAQASQTEAQARQELAREKSEEMKSGLKLGNKNDSNEQKFQLEEAYSGFTESTSQISFSA